MDYVARPIGHGRSVHEGHSGAGVPHHPPQKLIGFSPSDILPLQHPCYQMVEGGFQNQKAIGVNIINAIHCRAFDHRRAVHPMQHTGRGNRMQTRLGRYVCQGAQVIRIKPIIRIQKRNCVGALTHRVIAANQPRRITVISVVPLQQNMCALEVRNLRRMTAVTHQYMPSRGKLLFDAHVRLDHPGGILSVVRGNHADLHGDNHFPHDTPKLRRRVYTISWRQRGLDSLMIRLIGLDPGLRFTGWGVIDVDGNRLRHVGDGVIATNSDDPVPLRLKILHDSLMELLGHMRPAEAAVEETYINRSGAASLKLGYARGVALLTPALAGIAVTEYGAKTVKKSVVGTGGANKDQVEMMIRRLLPGALIRRADAADALAVAICHAHHRSSRLAWTGAGRGAAAATSQ